MYYILDCLGLFKEKRLIRIKSYDPMHPATARSKCSLIRTPGIFICNPFVNANTLVLLKIILKIVLIMRILALDFKRLLFLFVELWVAIKESSGPILADLRRGYEGIRIRLCKNVVCGRTNHRKFS